MKANFEATKPEDINFTMTIALTMKEWKSLATRLEGGYYPDTDLRYKINDLVRQAETTFYTLAKAPEEQPK